MIDESTEIVRKRRRVHEEGGELTKWSTLFSCSLDVPPDYATDKAVEKVAELGYTVTKDELAKCKHKLADGKRIYRLYYTRHVYLGARQGTLLFKVFCDGEEWARSEIKYETM